jgi:hypothetical protein
MITQRKKANERVLLRMYLGKRLSDYISDDNIELALVRTDYNAVLAASLIYQWYRL